MEYKKSASGMVRFSAIHEADFLLCDIKSLKIFP